MKIIVPDFELKGLSAEDRAVLSQIFAGLSGAANSILEAGQLWIGLRESVREKVLNNVPPTWRKFLARLERVGQGTLHPMLYSAASNASTWLAKMPIDDQDRFLRERIPVAIKRGGKWDIKNLDVEEMSEEQRKQVFKTVESVVIVRSIEEQQAYAAEQEKRKERQEAAELGNLTVINRPGRWKVEKGRVWPDKIKLTDGLTKRDLTQMLKDLGA
jgi:hypothetical protein